MEEIQFKGVSPNYLVKILSLGVRGRGDQGCDDIISMYHASMAERVYKLPYLAAL